MDLSSFIVEFVSDVQEKYARMEVTRKGDPFAFLDFSINDDKDLVLNFWSKDTCVQVPINLMKELLEKAEVFKVSAINNADSTTFDTD